VLSAISKKKHDKKQGGDSMQGNRLYVGNLNYSVDKDQLKELFSAFGEVLDIKIIENKGFGFVEMSTQVEAEKAKKELNNTYFFGRNINVDEAKPAKSQQRGKRPQRRY